MTEDEITKLEIQNGFRQFDYSMEAVDYFLDPSRPFSLRPSLILEFQSLAVQGIDPSPGQFRRTPVRIEKAVHNPPPPHLVETLVTEMCDYVNNNWHEKTPFHLAAYAMWRHNWIHPFADGNGRTSRVLSYVILCIALGYRLPGTPAIPQQIQDDRSGYFKALEAADEAALKDEIDVSVMEELLKNMLARQLLSVIETASGTQAQ